MTDTHPGCLVAAFVYETRLFDDEIRSLMGRGILDWRQMIVNRLTDIAAKYPPKVDTSLEVLADMFTSILEGGITKCSLIAPICVWYLVICDGLKQSIFHSYAGIHCWCLFHVLLWLLQTGMGANVRT